MINIGITGQSGFIGYHIIQHLRLNNDEYNIIQFKKDYFEDEDSLFKFVSDCDVIIHLAAMNRGDNDEIYNTNISLVNKLISAMENASATPQIIFSSSTQETLDNFYGKSKKIGAELFSDWADKNNAVFTHFVIPNVFGPFGRPYYNSVVATFCYQLTHGDTPKIITDSLINLIYVGDLAKDIISKIGAVKSETVSPKEITEIKVSDLLSKLEIFKEYYFEQGIIPSLQSKFDINLFNTFRCFANEIMPIYPELHSDERGTFVEIMKEMTGGQTSFSTTAAGVTRGNHYHLRKIERFCVIKGNALIQTRRVGTDEVNEYYVSGDKPAFIDMPIYYTHNIKNIGDEELLTMFWINELFNPDDSDMYYEVV